MEEMPRKPARMREEDATDQTNVLKRYQIPIPDYLANCWSVTKDADIFIRCRFNDMNIGSADASMAGIVAGQAF